MSIAQVYLIAHKTESRIGLAFSLQGEGLQVHAFKSVLNFLHWVDYDTVASNTCVVSELNMPEMSGIDLQGVFDADEVNLPIVFIHEGRPRDEQINRLQQCSIPVFFKPVDPRQLARTVQAEFKRRQSFSKITEKIDEKQCLRDRISTLSPREMEVLACVFDGLLNKLIADRLSISIKTVEMHRSRMMQKMRVKSTIELIKMVTFYGGVPQLHSANQNQ